MNSAIFNGCIPALMTPVHKERTPNFSALVEKAESLIDHGMSAVVYCGSMGDWPLLSDEQRQEGVQQLCAAGVPVIVGTGAPSTRQAVAHAAHAQQVGAKGLMIIPRLLSRATSPAAQRTHFIDILRVSPDLPAVIYNSPYYGFETKADLFFELQRNFPNLVGFKEFGGGKALSYAAEHITNADQDVLLMAGVDTQVFHGIVNCGAVGAITGIGNCLPVPVLRLMELCYQAASGNVAARSRALELEAALKVLSTFDEGPDLVLYYKYLLLLQGETEYKYNINPEDKLTSSQQNFAETQWNLFLAWWQNWAGKTDCKMSEMNGDLQTAAAAVGSSR